MPYVDDELLELSKQAISVVENAVEAKHSAIHLEELSKFVKVRRCFCHLNSETFNASSCVRICWTVFRGVQYYTFTFQPILHTLRHTHTHCTVTTHQCSISQN